MNRFLRLNCRNNMKIGVYPLGVLKNVASQSRLQVTMPEGHTVAQLRAQLLVEYPLLQAISSFVIVVNNALVPSATVLQPTDKVVVMSPLSGG